MTHDAEFFRIQALLFDPELQCYVAVDDARKPVGFIIFSPYLHSSAHDTEADAWEEAYEQLMLASEAVDRGTE